MTTPEALAILALPEDKRVAAVDDLLRERDDLRAALAECDEADARRARIERLELTADDEGWCINAHAEVVQLLAQTILAAIRSGTATNYVEHELTATLSFGDVRIIATTYAPGGLSPHELRMRAEKERDDLRARLSPIDALDLDAPRCRSCWTIPRAVKHSMDSDPFQSGALNCWPGGWRLDCPVCGFADGGPEVTWPATLRTRLPEPVLAAIVAAQGVSRE